MTKDATKGRYRYFFLEGKLYKLLSVKRFEDTCVAWCNSEQKKYLYQWSYIKKHSGRAWTTRDIGKFMHVHPKTVWEWVEKGMLGSPEITIPPPSPRYDPTTWAGGRRTGYWTTQQLEDMFAMMDGMPYYSHKVPSKRELKAFEKYDMLLYAKTDDGEFVPVWEAETW